MPIQTRGGVPRVFRASISTSGYDDNGHRLPSDTLYLQINNEGANGLRVYFTPEDYTADTNYVSIASNGAWEGPAEVRQVWLRAVTGATTAMIVSFSRKG